MGWFDRFRRKPAEPAEPAAAAEAMRAAVRMAEATVVVGPRPMDERRIANARARRELILATLHRMDLKGDTAPSLKRTRLVAHLQRVEFDLSQAEG